MEEKSCIPESNQINSNLLNKSLNKPLNFVSILNDKNSYANISCKQDEAQLEEPFYSNDCEENKEGMTFKAGPNDGRCKTIITLDDAEKCEQNIETSVRNVNPRNLENSQCSGTKLFKIQPNSKNIKLNNLKSSGHFIIKLPASSNLKIGSPNYNVYPMSLSTSQIKNTFKIISHGTARQEVEKKGNLQQSNLKNPFYVKTITSPNKLKNNSNIKLNILNNSNSETLNIKEPILSSSSLEITPKTFRKKDDVSHCDFAHSETADNIRPRHSGLDDIKNIHSGVVKSLISTSNSSTLSKADESKDEPKLTNSPSPSKTSNENQIKIVNLSKLIEPDPPTSKIIKNEQTISPTKNKIDSYLKTRVLNGRTGKIINQSIKSFANQNSEMDESPLYKTLAAAVSPFLSTLNNSSARAIEEEKIFQPDQECNTVSHFSSNLSVYAIEQLEELKKENVNVSAVEQIKEKIIYDTNLLPIPGPSAVECMRIDPSQAATSEQFDTLMSEVKKIKSALAKDKNIKINISNADRMSNILSEEKKNCYVYNKIIPLTFVQQNVLEFMFKYESFPSSANMSRLAKLMNAPWKAICDWFLMRRIVNKRNGFLPPPQTLLNCSFCPTYVRRTSGWSEAEPIVHLLSREHVRNIEREISKDQKDFNQHLSGENETFGTIVNSRKKKITRTRTTTPDNKQISAQEILLDVSERDSAPVLPQTSPFRDGKVPQGWNSKEESEKDVQTSISSPKKFKPRTVTPGLLRNFERKICVGYRCPQCLKIFQSEWTLIRHVLSHQSFVCHDCGETFIYELQLQRHLKQHLILSMDEDLRKHYACDVCEQLDCICESDSRCVPPMRKTHYVHPQIARRSKPFAGVPCSGVNDHLRVSLKQFLKEFDVLQNVSTKEKSDSWEDKFKNIKTGKADQGEKAGPTYTNFHTFTCDECEAFFFTPDELKDHGVMHRMQARNKRLKKSPENPQAAKPKPNQSGFVTSPPLDPLYYCVFCNRGYKREKALLRHFKFECKLLPKSIAERVFENVPLQVDKTEKANYYSVSFKSPYQSSEKNVRIFRCDYCLAVLGSRGHLTRHKSKCLAKPKNLSISKPTSQFFSKPASQSTSKPENQSISKPASQSISKPESHSSQINKGCPGKSSIYPNMNRESYFFVCVYCQAPLLSEYTLHHHLIDSCIAAPQTLKSELKNKNLFLLEASGKADYYTKINRSDLLIVLPLEQIKAILDVSTFVLHKTNFKKLRCKFCNIFIVKSCLKTHIKLQCRSIGLELHEIFNKFSNFLFENHTENTDIFKSSATTDVNMSEAFVEQDAVGCIKEEEINLDEMMMTEFTESEIETSQPDKVFSCHLCEYTSPICDNFLNHTATTHCKTLSSKAAQQWLIIADESKYQQKRRGFDDDDEETAEDSPTKRARTDFEGEQLMLEDEDNDLDNLFETVQLRDDSFGATS